MKIGEKKIDFLFLVLLNFPYDTKDLISSWGPITPVPPARILCLLLGDNGDGSWDRFKLYGVFV